MAEVDDFSICTTRLGHNNASKVYGLGRASLLAEKRLNCIEIGAIHGINSNHCIINARLTV
jgi:hypothetical protein